MSNNQQSSSSKSPPRYMPLKSPSSSRSMTTPDLLMQMTPKVGSRYQQLRRTPSHHKRQQNHNAVSPINTIVNPFSVNNSNNNANSGNAMITELEGLMSKELEIKKRSTISASSTLESQKKRNRTISAIKLPRSRSTASSDDCATMDSSNSSSSTFARPMPKTRSLLLTQNQLRQEMDLEQLERTGERSKLSNFMLCTNTTANTNTSTSSTISSPTTLTRKSSISLDNNNNININNNNKRRISTNTLSDCSASTTATTVSPVSMGDDGIVQNNGNINSTIIRPISPMMISPIRAVKELKRRRIDNGNKNALVPLSGNNTTGLIIKNATNTRRNNSPNSTGAPMDISDFEELL